MEQDFSTIPLWWEGQSSTTKETEHNRRIREHFGQETDKELCMEIGDMAFTLVHISLEDEENIKKFSPYGYEGVVGEYGLVWKMGCLKDLYVFDSREHAVDFIVMSGRWG